MLAVTEFSWTIFPREQDAIALAMTLMTTILLSFLIILSAIAAMAVGVLLGNRKIRGSCGGIAAGGCELCGDDSNATPSPDT